MDLKWQILSVLADGKFHSGQKLAHMFSVSRAAVWKIIQQWQVSGMPIDAITGRGYRLREAFAPLAPAQLQTMHPDITLHFVEEIESTNSFLLHNVPRQGLAVCAAEQQTRGRGRRDRSWLSLPGYSLTFSLAERTARPMSDLTWLPLVAGVAVSSALTALGFKDIGIKWPNDIVVKTPAGGFAKLAGMLMEVSGGFDGDALWVLGIGLNVGRHILRCIKAEYPCTALAVQNPQATCMRNEILFSIIASWKHWSQRFWQEGPSGIRSEWLKYDILVDKPVLVRQADGVFDGIVVDLDIHGRLVVETNGTHQIVSAGDVSIRTKF